MYYAATEHVPTAGTSSLYYHNQDVSTFFAMNLNASRGAVGTIMWTKNIDMTFVNRTNEIVQKTLYPRRRRRFRNAGNAITYLA